MPPPSAKVLLPVFIDEVSPPLGLAPIHGADLVEWTAQGGGAKSR